MVAECHHHITDEGMPEFEENKISKVMYIFFHELFEAPASVARIEEAR